MAEPSDIVPTLEDSVGEEWLATMDRINIRHECDRVNKVLSSDEHRCIECGMAPLCLLPGHDDWDDPKYGVDLPVHADVPEMRQALEKRGNWAQ